MTNGKYKESGKSGKVTASIVSLSQSLFLSIFVSLGNDIQAGKKTAAMLVSKKKISNV
jgi:hypothetical protein